MKKVATFSRVSTMDQHTSIENQEKVFLQWFDSHKECILYKAYVDEGISGAKAYKRIKWNQMIRDGLNKDFEILVCKSFSRFGRNQRETLDAISKLRIAGVRIIFLEDNLDSEKDMANFGLMAWLSEKEANSTSERIKMVWDSFNVQGKIHTPIPIYGYDYDKTQKNYFVNKIEALIVKKIFNMYIAGYGYNRICNDLLEKGVATKRGGKWQGNTIAKMIINEFYIGTLVQGKTRTYDATIKGSKKIHSDNWYKHEKNHEAIIDKEIFLKAQKEVDKRSKKAKDSIIKDGKRTRNSNKNLFSNLLICGECGSRMYAKRIKRQNYRTFYNCLSYERLGTNCGHISNRYNEGDLQIIVKNELEVLSEDNFKVLQNIKYKKKDDIDNLKKELKMVKLNIDKQITLANGLLLNYTNGLLQQEIYSLQSENINNVLKNLLKQKEEINFKIKESENKVEEKAIFCGIETILNIAIENWNNGMLKEVIEDVTLKIDGTINIKIKYFN